MKYFEILIMGAISLTDKRDRVYLSLVKGEGCHQTEFYSVAGSK